MKQRLKDAAPWVLSAATAGLALLFGAPLGRGGERTTYEPLEGRSASLAPPSASSAPVAGLPLAGQAAFDLVATTVRSRFTPVEADGLMRQVERLTAPRPATAAPAPARKPARPPKPAKLVAPATPAAPAPEPPAAAPEAPVLGSEERPVTLDAVRDWFAGDAARYALDQSAAADGVTLALKGVSRWNNRGILKVSVDNGLREDLFLKEAAVYAGAEPLPSRSFLRLFVEPGRVREGYVVFDWPRPGSAVKIVLKEDRENGRALQAPVRYPF